MLSGRAVALYFYNPNIQPEEEYERRLAVLESFVEGQGVSLQVGPYDAGLWEEHVGILGGPYPLLPGSDDYALMEAARKKRCRACYELRFREAAAFGARAGYRYLDTTLTISPYQYTLEAQSALKDSGEEQGREVLATDWSGSYPQSVQRSRALGMYRQNYCGCRFSRQEAELERQAKTQNLRPPVSPG